ncbi:hypothetical protein [Nocardia miyunensis]|nr:hypothetical protein [Nocardia miyunensis]
MTMLVVVVSVVVFSTWGAGRLLDWRRGARWEAEWRSVDRDGTVAP